MTPLQLNPIEAPWLIIMVKQPRPGRVKTRLGRGIGIIDATWWYRHHVNQMVRSLRDPRWTLVAGFSPKTSRLVVGQNDIKIWQGNGDLGQRMIRLLRQAPPKSVLIGSDIAGLERRHIARAIGALGQSDSVLGPSPDGGFWLIGARHPKRLTRNVLEGARWSTQYALADTQARLPGKVALVDTLNDVDTIDDLP